MSLDGRGRRRSESRLGALVDASTQRLLRLRGRSGARVAFVLSGGGNLGAVQVGMLRALAEAGIRPDLVIGCSVGAINGAGFAAEPDLRGVERLERIWDRLATGQPDLMPNRRRIGVVTQLARRMDSIHDPSLLEDLLEEELTSRTFAELDVAFSCVATDIDTASEFWMDSGRLIPALMASAALPVVYPMVEHRGRRLIDGGVLKELHVERALELGANELFVLHVGHLLERDTPEVQRPLDSALRAYWVARRFRLREDLAELPSHCTVHRLPAGSSTHGLRFHDFSRSTELAEAAYEASVGYLQAAGFSVRRSPRAVRRPPEPVPDRTEPDDPVDTAEPVGAQAAHSGGEGARPRRASEWPKLKPVRTNGRPSGDETR